MKQERETFTFNSVLLVMRII